MFSIKTFKSNKCNHMCNLKIALFCSFLYSAICIFLQELGLWHGLSLVHGWENWSLDLLYRLISWFYYSYVMRKISPGNSLKMYLIVHVKYLQSLNNSFNLEDIANKENKISERRVSNASLLNLFLNSRSSIFLSRRCKPSDPNVV